MRTREEKKRALRIQRLMGLALLVICAAFLALVWTAPAFEDTDGTPVILLFPLALLLLLSHDVLIYY